MEIENLVERYGFAALLTSDHQPVIWQK